MLCTHSTEKLLGLKEVIVKNVRQLTDRTEIAIELPQKPHLCPCCGHQTRLCARLSLANSKRHSRLWETYRSDSAKATVPLPFLWKTLL